MEFKVGDRVKVISKKLDIHEFYNRIGIIKKIDGRNRFPFFIRFSKKKNDHFVFSKSEIKLYNPTLKKFIEEMEKKDDK